MVSPLCLKRLCLRSATDCVAILRYGDALLGAELIQGVSH